MFKKFTEKVEIHFIFVYSLCDCEVRKESYKRGLKKSAEDDNTDVYPKIKKHTIYRNPKKPKKPGL